jgi:hypothetical protein
VSEVVLYDEMCRAIQAAHRVDEAKEIRDKARALEVYFRQAQNIENERRAREIRLRAERRAGQIRAEMDKARGAAEPGTDRGATRLPDVTASAPTNDELGITKRQSASWQKLAAIPEADFECAIRDPVRMPTTAWILRAAAAVAASMRRGELNGMRKRATLGWRRQPSLDRAVGIITSALDAAETKRLIFALRHAAVSCKELAASLEDEIEVAPNGHARQPDKEDLRERGDDPDPDQHPLHRATDGRDPF